MEYTHEHMLLGETLQTKKYRYEFKIVDGVPTFSQYDNQTGELLMVDTKLEKIHYHAMDAIGENDE